MTHKADNPNMPARDVYHDAVKQALIKDGWTITADPYTIEYEEMRVFADLAAERSLAAEREGQKIVVEIKSFLSPSFVRDLESALGQYILYRNLLSLTASDQELYLAVSDRIYNNFFQQKAVQFIVKQNQMHLMVVNITQEVITLWIK